MRRPTTQWLKPRELTFDPQIIPFQRLPQNRIKRIKILSAKFDLAVVGTFQISKRPDGKFVIMNGAGRWYVMTVMRPEFADEPILCEIYDGLTIKEEANMFLAQTNQTTLNSSDLFRAKVVRGDEKEVNINNILTSLKLKVGVEWPYGFRGTSALYSLYDRGLLEKTMMFLLSTCKEHTVVGFFAEAVGNILASEPLLDETHMRKLFQKYSPNDFKELCRGLSGGRKYHPHDMPGYLAQTIAVEYNKRLKPENRIDLDELAKTSREMRMVAHHSAPRSSRSMRA
jgi:hypothetical protein